LILPRSCRSLDAREKYAYYSKPEITVSYIVLANYFRVLDPARTPTVSAFRLGRLNEGVAIC